MLKCLRHLTKGPYQLRSHTLMVPPTTPRGTLGSSGAALRQSQDTIDRSVPLAMANL
jgi:hypothetical protein